MTDYELYKKVLPFTLIRFLFALLYIGILASGLICGYLFGPKLIPGPNGEIYGPIVLFFIALICALLLNTFVAYRYKAAEIAVMAKAIKENKLPDYPFEEGKKMVRQRFLTVYTYRFITRGIRRIFNRFSNRIVNISSKAGKVGNIVSEGVTASISIFLSYLNDCTLGWIFVKDSIPAGRAACEGIGIFFKHGRTLAKNGGRIFGIGILSFIALTGIFGGISLLIWRQFPDLFEYLSTYATSEGNEPLSPTQLMLLFSFITGVVFWGVIHSLFVHPFILVGVMRNYINSGREQLASESDYDEIRSKSKYFDRLWDRT